MPFPPRGGCRGRVLPAALAVALAIASPLHAGAVLFVDDDAPAGGDGSNWTTALRFLRDALAEAAEPVSRVSEIRVAQGTYRPDRIEAVPDGTGDREATFALLSGVALRGGYAGAGEPDPDARDVELYATILSGDLLADDGPDFAGTFDNSFHVVVALNVDATAVLDGFQVSGGRADGPTFGASPLSQDQGSAVNVFFATPQLVNCTFTANWAESRGTVNDHGGATLLDCTFEGNFSDTHAGGLYVHDDVATTLIGCRFIGNAARVNGGGAYNAGSDSVSLTECLFSGNLAAAGGGLYCTQGSVTVLTGCTFIGNESTSVTLQGGAIFSNGASPQLSGCVFTGNTAASGGAVYLAGGLAGQPSITDCTFQDNTATSRAGALSIGHANTLVTGCTFIGNTVDQWGGAVWTDEEPLITACTFTGNFAGFSGGAFYAWRGAPLVTACTFTGNSAANFGGAVSCVDEFADAVFTDCVFSGNVAGFGGAVYNNEPDPVFVNCTFLGNLAGGWGGVVYSAFSDAVFTNCVLSGNTAVSFGGAVYNFRSSPALTNCTLASNSAGIDGGGVFNQLEANPVLTNCILWANTDGGPTDESAQIFTLVSGQTVVNHSIVQGWTGALGGLGNFGDDPLLVNLDDLRLRPGSPAIDAGDNLAVPPGVTDLDGNPRFADDPCTDDTGVGDGVHPLVDLGAFEFQGSSRPGDVDGDCVVGIIDLLALLGNWGACPGLPEPCPADLDGDGVVGITDFLLLLGDWG